MSPHGWADTWRTETRQGGRSIHEVTLIGPLIRSVGLPVERTSGIILRVGMTLPQLHVYPCTRRRRSD